MEELSRDCPDAPKGRFVAHKFYREQLPSMAERKLNRSYICVCGVRIEVGAGISYHGAGHIEVDEDYFESCPEEPRAHQVGCICPDHSPEPYEEP